MRLSLLRATRMLAVPLILAVGVPLIVAGQTGRPAAATLRYAPGPGEIESLGALERYWSTRLTYPTGRFDQRWLLTAAQQDRLVKSAIPAGKKWYTRAAASGSPLTLSPSGFTSLGPKPEQMTSRSWGHVSGRVNSIAIDPVDTTVAYIASVGGGVWKTTNCCTPSTSWTPVTDQPDINGTSIDDITIDPNDHNTVYAGTGDLNFGSFAMGAAGILKSTDQGATWQVLGEDVFTPIYPPELTPGFPQYQAVGKVRVDPNNSNTVVAGTKTGLFFSYDAGVNWAGPCLTNSHAGQRQDVTGMLTRDNGGTATLYVATGTRGYATTVQPDLGKNGANGIYSATIPASAPPGGCPDTSAWSLLTTSANGWPAGTGDGIGCNPPIGSTTACGAGTNRLGRIDLAMAPSDPNVIYAEVQSIDAGCGRGCFLGLWRTGDAGATWTEQAAPFTGSCGSGSSDSAQNWYNQALAVSPANPSTLFIDMIDIWRSADGGATMTDVSCGYGSGTTHVDQHALAFVPGSSTTLLAGNDGGIYLSTNANAATPTFTPLNDSLNTIEFYSGDISANFATSANPVAVGGAQDNGSSSIGWSGNPGPALWTERNGGDGMFARIEQKLGQRVFMESQWGAVVRSTTGHAGSYSSASGGWGPGNPASGDRESFVTPYEIDKHVCKSFAGVDESACNHVILGTYRVWESITASGTQSWYINSPDLTKGTLADRSFVGALMYGHTDNKIALAGTNDGNVWFGFGLGQGTANTASWVNVTGGNTVLPNRPILDVTTHATDPLSGFVSVGGFSENTPATPGHVYQVSCTANCGSFTWLDKSGNLPNIPADSIAVNPNFPNQVFAGTDWGLYFTDDISVASPVWSRFENGLPHVMIWDMAVDRGATTLAVFTRSRGAYAWPLPVPDLTPPVTAVSVSPAPLNGWYRDPTVTLSATDNDVGVDYSEYRLDGGPWTAYTVPFQVTQDGSHTLEYRSIDVAGNLEAIKAFGIGFATTTLFTATSAGATNVKVASVPKGLRVGKTQIGVGSGAGLETAVIAAVGTPGVNTTLAANALPLDTNIKVASVAGLQAGDTISIDTGPLLETRTIQAVGTAGAGGTGVTLTAALSLLHASGAAVVDPGSGITFTPAVAQAHAGGEPVSFTTTTLQVDGTAPAITIAEPSNGATYARNENVTASYSCNDDFIDDESGTDSCTGTVPDLSPIDTSTSGTHTFTVVARDLAGNERTQTVVYYVDRPTAVTVRSFTATRSRGQVVLRWRMASSAQTLGFNLYRTRGSSRVKLNRRLIAGVASGAGRGQAYAWRDRAPVRRSRYWLQEVSLDGKRVLHGPAAPR